MIKLLFITTTIKSSDSEKNLNMLYDSIRKNFNDKKYETICYLLIQNDKEKCRLELNSEVVKFSINETISLSEARNYLLNEFKNSKNNNCNYIFFPDDDCWYPNLNLRDIVDYMVKKDVELLITKYRFDGHEKLAEKNITEGFSKKMMNSSSSITIMVKYNLFEHFMKFDEQYGLGAINVGGEDLDYFLSLVVNSKKSHFIDSYLIGHPDKSTVNKIKYYFGSLSVLKKHKNNKFYIKILYYRKICVGLYYVLKNKINFIDLLKYTK